MSKLKTNAQLSTFKYYTEQTVIVLQCIMYAVMYAQIVGPILFGGIKTFYPGSVVYLANDNLLFS